MVRRHHRCFSFKSATGESIEPQRDPLSSPSSWSKVARQRMNITDVPCTTLAAACPCMHPPVAIAKEKQVSADIPPSTSSMLVVLLRLAQRREKGNSQHIYPVCCREASDLRKCGTIIHPGMLRCIAKSRACRYDACKIHENKRKVENSTRLLSSRFPIISHRCCKVVSRVAKVDSINSRCKC